MHSFISSEITDTIHAIQNDPVHYAKGTTYFFKGKCNPCISSKKTIKYH